ncbi:condensation domain-containing protein [Amycolatopsis sp. CA-128772]|uniref:condensation domain-containing protein n=1 Tax=Amycolatopsis sp. CA-128772 TaxID=2073159 RepID=UPI000CD296F1|nr:condensation domain-containing protein [Amycolatopsis sp. CA-128772]
MTAAAPAVGTDPADLPDDHWSAVPAFGLLDDADRARLPAGAVDAFPMTAQQVAMAAQLVLGSARRRKGAADVPAYHNVAMSRMSVPAVDTAVFAACAEALVDRHEMFRSVLDLDTFSQPMQVVLARAAEPVLTVHDLRGRDAAAQEAALARFAAAENAKTLSLTAAPLTRFTLHVLSERDIAFTITEPHAIADGWSTHLNLVELFDTYVAALGTGRAAVTPPPSARLRHHSAQQEAMLKSTMDNEWWRARLRPWTEAPVPAPAGGSSAWHATLAITGAEFAALAELAEVSGTGLKAVLLTVHLTALRDLPGAAGTLTGVTVNTRLAVEDGVDARGMFLNVVPLPWTGDGPEPAAVRAGLLAATARGRVPLAHLVGTLGPAAAPRSLFVFNSFHSIAGAARRLGIDTFEEVADWSRTDFPFEASFNRSEELAGRIDLQLYSDGRFALEPDAVRAYRAAVRAVTGLGDD